jgi:hypothetical protein
MESVPPFNFRILKISNIEEYPYYIISSYYIPLLLVQLPIFVGC